MSSNLSSRGAALVSLRDARERSISRLTDAFAHDQLDLEEFERRLTVAHRTDSLTELETLCRDLTVTAETALAPTPAPVASTTALSVREYQRLLLVMGGTTRQGRWTPARRLRIVAVMGGAELDFRDAVLAPGVYTVDITAVMGGVSIIVPPHLAVEVEGTAVLGGFDHSERAPSQPDPERPVLRIQGLAVMGGVHVETRLVGDRQPHGADRQRRRELAAGHPRALPPRRDPDDDPPR